MNKAFLGAYHKGIVAGRDGKTIRDCPYGDWRTYRGAVTFSRAFIKYWEEGLEAGNAGCTCQYPYPLGHFVDMNIVWKISDDCPVHR